MLHHIARSKELGASYQTPCRACSPLGMHAVGRTRPLLAHPLIYIAISFFVFRRAKLVTRSREAMSVPFAFETTIMLVG